MYNPEHVVAGAHIAVLAVGAQHARVRDVRVEAEVQVGAVVGDVDLGILRRRLAGARRELHSSVIRTASTHAASSNRPSIVRGVRARGGRTSGRARQDPAPDATPNRGASSSSAMTPARRPRRRPRAPAERPARAAGPAPGVAPGTARRSAQGLPPLRGGRSQHGFGRRHRGAERPAAAARRRTRRCGRLCGRGAGGRLRRGRRCRQPLDVQVYKLRPQRLHDPILEREQIIQRAVYRGRPQDHAGLCVGDPRCDAQLPADPLESARHQPGDNRRRLLCSGERGADHDGEGRDHVQTRNHRFGETLAQRRVRRIAGEVHERGDRYRAGPWRRGLPLRGALRRAQVGR